MISSSLPEASTDTAAIRRSLREPRAFTIVFDRHFDAVHAYAARRVGPDLADEIAAETFARAFDRRRSFDADRSDARPWLLGIATNLMRRHWRSERRRLDAYARAARVAAGDGVTDLGASLVAALDELASRDREALLLLAFADLSYAEIADALGIPVGTVRSRLSRARRIVRERLDSGSPSLSTPQPDRGSSHA